MEELLNLKYKEEVEALKDLDNFEEEGDRRYLNHHDKEARLYWAFCRPSGSHPGQLEDAEPLVAVMAFNHSRLRPLERFQALNRRVVDEDNLRVKIRNRTRMLFRDLADGDFREMNQVLDLVPVFLPAAVDQLKNGRKWNDTGALEEEATRFLKRVDASKDPDFLEALLKKLTGFDEFDSSELKEYLEELLKKKEQVAKVILEDIIERVTEWLEESDLHILQKKAIEKLAKELV